jgi:protein-L-isoaspartate(D-aspartate) O-methyltransferase
VAVKSPPCNGFAHHPLGAALAGGYQVCECIDADHASCELQGVSVSQPAANFPVPDAAFDALSARKAMIESQLKPCGIVSPRLVAAFYAVAREDFVPAARRGLAYVDGDQPLGHGRSMMPALSLGTLLQQAGVRPEDRVLVIGSGTGYSASLLSHLSGNVTALESEPALAAASRALLEARDVTVAEGPLEAGWQAGAPYSFILIDGAVELLPPSIIAQLAEGGRVAAILVGRDGVSRAALGSKRGDLLHFEPFAECGAALLPPFRKPAVFQF